MSFRCRYNELQRASYLPASGRAVYRIKDAAVTLANLLQSSSLEDDWTTSIDLDVTASLRYDTSFCSGKCRCRVVAIPFTGATIGLDDLRQEIGPNPFECPKSDTPIDRRSGRAKTNHSKLVPYRSQLKHILVGMKTT